MTFSKYSIHHLDLAGRPAPYVGTGGQARYCVFWYGSIPLGELYLDATESVDDLSFWARCLEAIGPTLKRYADRYCPDYRPPMSAVDAGTIADYCEKVLSSLMPAPRRHADVSIVICTRDRAPYLKKCLEQLGNQSCAPLEIIVVDNASKSRETRRVCDAFGVQYIREERPGLDVARNTGARAAKGSLIAYCDDDTQADPYWIHRIAETFEDKTVSAMTGLVITASLETEAEVIFEKFWPFNRGYADKVYDPVFFRAWLPWGPPVWEIGAGANMAFRAEVFRTIGYFDERLDAGAAGCNGDSELWYRMLANGMRIHYNPRAVVFHQHRNSMTGLQRQLFSYMRGFTVAILIQYQRFGHEGNLRHLFGRLPMHYLRLLKRGFPHYPFQYKTVFAEMRGILSGLLYFLRNRNKDPKIYGHES